jgi:hypothetical protein
MPTAAPARSFERNDWRSWHEKRPCVLCGGHKATGRSGQQCVGGYFAERPRTVFCSTTPSRQLSRTGRTYRHEVAEPVEWVVEPAQPSLRKDQRDQLPRFSALPFDLERDARYAWRAVGRWDYTVPSSLVLPSDWSVAPGDGPNPAALFDLASLPRSRGAVYAYSVIRFHALDLRTGEPAVEDGHPMKTYRAARAERPEDPATPFCWRVPAESLVPYRLSELLAGIREGKGVVFLEGEKSCDFFAQRFGDRYVATTAVGGALRFDRTPYWSTWLRGLRRAQIVVDRDENGRRWARSVLDALRELEPRPRVALWQSATTRPGDDLVDHINAGHPLSAMVPIAQESLYD